MEQLSERLRDSIATYCHHIDANLVGDLAEVIQEGSMPWFVEEFADAIRAGAFTPHSWGILTRTDLDDDDFDEMNEDLHYVWSQVAPDRPYPQREPAE